MKLHPSAFDSITITLNAETKATMQRLRDAAKFYANALTDSLPDGPDKTYCLRKVRDIAMWANVALLRHPNGAPRMECGTSEEIRQVDSPGFDKPVRPQ